MSDSGRKPMVRWWVSTEAGRRYLVTNAALLVSTVIGCGSGDGFPQVSGVVMLDGEAVPNAIVSFYPAQGRAASGVTDQRGRYRIEYSPNASGAPVGDYRVTVSTWRPSRPQQGVDAQSLPETPETIPPRYASRERSQLTAKVVSGENEIDFALTSLK